MSDASLHEAVQRRDASALWRAVDGYRNAAGDRALVPTTTLNALLRSAVLSDAPECVVVLATRCGADINTTDFVQRSLLWQAAGRSSELVAAVLRCSVADVNAMSPSGDYGTALINAARAGLCDNVRLLLDAGADANLATPGSRDTPLIASVKMHDRPAVVRLLLERGAHANAADARGMTPLHWAADYCRPRSARVLLLHHADCAAKNDLQLTPLDVAKRLRRPDDPVVALLAVHPRQGVRDLIFRVCVGLHELELPVLVLLEIVEHAAADSRLAMFLPKYHTLWECAKKIRHGGRSS